MRDGEPEGRESLIAAVRRKQMSYDLSVHLTTKRMPTPQEWQASIARHGFPLRIYTDFDVTALSGWLPCEYQGKKGGFEYSYAVLDNQELSELEVPQRLPCMISFSVSARAREEFLSAVISAAVLAEITEGLVVDPQEGRSHESTLAIRWAKDVESSFQHDRTIPRCGHQPSHASTPWWKFW
jgi:hypothetical protein